MLAGLAAAAVSVGVAQLFAPFFSPAADVRSAVGSAVIDMTPGPIKEWAIQTFGTGDKLFLSVMVLVTIGAAAAIAAQWERPGVPVGSLAIAVGGAVGISAVSGRPGAQLEDVLPTLLAVLCGIGAMRLLTSDTGAKSHDADRRRSLQALGFIGLGVLSGVAGEILTRRLRSVEGDRSGFALPEVQPPAAPIDPAVQPKGVELPSFITGNADFYRIDTALRVPQVARGDWRLRVHGMVEREATYSFTDLERFEPVEATVTLACVSNPVGGDLISTATWTGYRLRDLLRDSGVHPDADMVLSTSADGFTAGTPVEALTDGRDAMLAIGMNGVPLPVEHGYPARLVVPGLYGFVSATKWVTDLELTRFDRAEAYWTKLGWAARAPIKTQSRIDVPREGQRIPRGPVTFGGVAWAQHRGIRAVEVRLDDGPWQAAQLAVSYSKDTWRLWSFAAKAEPGPHTLSVRAIDNTGAVQTGERASVVPDGATGWHTVSFDVE